MGPVPPFPRLLGPTSTTNLLLQRDGLSRVPCAAGFGSEVLLHGPAFSLKICILQCIYRRSAELGFLPSSPLRKNSFCH